jgi:hypothetical protein
MVDNASKSFGFGTLDMSKLATLGAAYQRKLLEIHQANARAAFDYASALASCRSPVDFMNVTQDYTTKQIEAVHQQAKELMALAKSPE